MSTFNTKETIMAGGKNVNFDRQLYRLTPEWELYTTVVNTLGLEGTFYETGNERIRRIRKLVSVCDHRFTAQLAVYARQKMNLRTIPIILIVELAAIHRGDSLVSKTVEKCILRADEITELLACYQWHNKNGHLKGMSAQLIKGLRTVFNRFDEYQFAKYSFIFSYSYRPGCKKAKKIVTLRDALFLVHPKAKDEHQQQIFDRLAKNELQPPYTWEHEKAALQKRRYSSFGERLEAEHEMWEEMVVSGRLGTMALIRNLSRMYSLGISDEALDKVCEQLLDKEKLLKSGIMPFRLYNVLCNLKNINSSTGHFGYSYHFKYSHRCYRQKIQNIIKYQVYKKVKYRIEYPCSPNARNLLFLLSEKNGDVQLGKHPTYTTHIRRKRWLWRRRTRNLYKIRRRVRKERRIWKKYCHAFELSLRHDQNPPRKLWRLCHVINDACEILAGKIKGFDANTRVLIAGYLSREMSERTIHKESVVKLKHIALYLSNMLAYKCDNVLFGWITTKFSPVLIKNTGFRLEDYKALDEMWYITQPQPANGLGVLKWMTRKREVRDKIIIFTDGQILFGSMFTEQWKKYKRLVNPDAKLYIFDLGGSGTTPVKSEDNDVFTIAGWNDSVFDILENLEQGESALNQIRSIKL